MMGFLIVEVIFTPRTMPRETPVGNESALVLRTELEVARRRSNAVMVEVAMVGLLRQILLL